MVYNRECHPEDEPRSTTGNPFPQPGNPHTGIPISLLHQGFTQWPGQIKRLRVAKGLLAWTHVQSTILCLFPQLSPPRQSNSWPAEGDYPRTSANHTIFGLILGLYICSNLQLVDGMVSPSPQMNRMPLNNRGTLPKNSHDFLFAGLSCCLHRRVSSLPVNE